jgi:hypothetical protein
MKVKGKQIKEQLEVPKISQGMSCLYLIAVLFILHRKFLTAIQVSTLVQVPPSISPNLAPFQTIHTDTKTHTYTHTHTHTHTNSSPIRCVQISIFASC